MQITVNIPDEVAAQAQARGLSPESYVEALIAENAPTEAASVSPAELASYLDAMARHSDKIPDLPIEAFSRESFYEGRE